MVADLTCYLNALNSLRIQKIIINSLVQGSKYKKAWTETASSCKGFIAYTWTYSLWKFVLFCKWPYFSLKKVNFLAVCWQPLLKYQLELVPENHVNDIVTLKIGMSILQILLFSHIICICIIHTLDIEKDKCICRDLTVFSVQLERVNPFTKNTVILCT